MTPRDIHVGKIYRGGAGAKQTRKVLAIAGGKLFYRDATPRRQQTTVALFAEWAINVVYIAGPTQLATCSARSPRRV